MEIRIATYEHIKKILFLNQKHLINNLSESQKQTGFIRIAYSETELKRIIDNQEIAIALDQDKVIGYYLVGKKSECFALTYQYNKAINFANEKMLPTDKIGYGCQVCIDESYRNKGLSREMLGYLVEKLNHKYDFLLSTISKENAISLQNSTSIGWKLIDEMETPKYYIYKI